MTCESSSKSTGASSAENRFLPTGAGADGWDELLGLSLKVGQHRNSAGSRHLLPSDSSQGERARCGRAGLRCSYLSCNRAGSLPSLPPQGGSAALGESTDTSSDFQPALRHPTRQSGGSTLAAACNLPCALA